MAQTEGSPPAARLVQVLQTDTAVVTYRAFIGVMTAVVVALVGVIGSGILDGQAKLQESMTRVQMAVARDKGRIDDQGDRITRTEHALDIISDRDGLLDHRVTVIEARQGFK